MLVSLNSSIIQSIVEKTCSTLKQDLVDLGVSSMTPVVDYNSIPSSMSIDDYLEKPDEFYDSVSSLYQELVTALQQQAEADASPRAYWDLAEKLMLRAVADAISSTQDDMRSENNDSTFRHNPSND
jgi:hypothetical protein